MAAQRLKPRMRPDTAEYIKTLHPGIKRKIKDAIKALTGSPDSGKRLQDELDGYLTYRVGTFRIIYRIGRTTLDIMNIGSRRTIYEETYRLLKKGR